MKQVYVVVAEGETDNCGVLAVFSTAEAADAYIRADEYGYGEDLSIALAVDHG